MKVKVILKSCSAKPMTNDRNYTTDKGLGDVGNEEVIHRGYYKPDPGNILDRPLASKVLQQRPQS